MNITNAPKHFGKKKGTKCRTEENGKKRLKAENLSRHQASDS